MRQIVFILALLVVAGTALGQDWEGDLFQGDLHGTVGVAYDSQFIWRGFDIYDDKGVVHYLADLNLWDTGLGVSVVGHNATSSGFVNLERWDYTLYYQNGIFGGEPYATNFRVGWVYYNYPDHPASVQDLQEGQAILSWPNILPIKGLCPSYVAVKVWPAQTDSYISRTGRGSISGWLHILMLDYGFTVPGIIPEIPEHLIKLHGELAYNDGWSWDGSNVNADFSHAVFGVSTDLYIDANQSISVTPSVYYQTNMEPSLNREDDDEFWAGVSLKYSF
jgi:hypothetical protein